MEVGGHTLFTSRSSVKQRVFRLKLEYYPDAHSMKPSPTGPHVSNFPFRADLSRA